MSRMSTLIGWRALVAVAAVPALLAGCVSKSKYDEVVDQNTSLQQQTRAQQAQLATQGERIGRLQGAIKYTVNSDLPFPPGKWRCPPRASRSSPSWPSGSRPQPAEQEIYARGYTDSASIGPALRREGVATNEVLSRRRAEDVEDFLASQGFKPEMLAAQGYGETSPIASGGPAGDEQKALEEAGGDFRALRVGP